MGENDQPGRIWFAQVEGEQRGPFNAPDLRILVQKGELAEDTPVWREGMAQWVRLVEILPTINRATASGIVPLPSGEQEEKTLCAFCDEFFPPQSMDLSYDAPACPDCRVRLNVARSLAYLVDGGGCFLLGGFAGFMVTFALAMLWQADMGYGSAFRAAAVIGYLAGYLVAIPILLTKDAWMDGKSPGKVLTGITVVERSTARTVNWRKSAARNWPLIIPFLPLWLAVQVWFGTGSRMGDGMAGTKVIFTRTRRRDLREKKKAGEQAQRQSRG